jgi:hypothetical protein
VRGFRLDMGLHIVASLYFVQPSHRIRSGKDKDRQSELLTTILALMTGTLLGFDILICLCRCYVDVLWNG